MVLPTVDVNTWRHLASWSDTAVRAFPAAHGADSSFQFIPRRFTIVTPRRPDRSSVDLVGAGVVVFGRGGETGFFGGGGVLGG
ncbi:hypothetical protein Sfulv_03100 [Streptomyces fulvorobeus]|uniref:Uncharacterized protein n=1 Tax=Streptomyces fulvorobeus TaxID=284028 RepID=A0A7J0BZ16_9ACTN|nr:hypothetical protein Sfulv_03100 [Streptomyces fulvorobeus]